MKRIENHTTTAVILSDFPALCRTIEDLLDRQIPIPFPNFLLPVVKVTHCNHCNALIAPCVLDNGRAFEAELDADRDGKVRADVTRIHNCWPPETDDDWSNE
jgi:hypothetical protein